jgi:uncharacterized SAM-dependent methyltransferase
MVTNPIVTVVQCTVVNLTVIRCQHDCHQLSTFHFEPFEAIHVEYSHKYTLSEIQDLAIACGFEIVENYFDSRHFFLDSLWRVPS